MFNQYQQSAGEGEVARGELPLKLTWTVNGAPITGYGKAALYQPRFRDSVLYIENPNEHDIGHNTCNVSNSRGYQTS